MINDDPRLNTLVKEGKHGDIVIIGAPFDYSRKRTINKGGEDNGPCCLRRFIPKVGPTFNPQYNIDLTSINVTDAGNIDIQDKNHVRAPEKAISKVSEEIFSLLKGNQLPFIFGGAKEGTYGASLAAKKAFPNSQHILIAGKPTLKRPYDGDKLTSDSLMTLLSSRSEHNLTVFGTSMRYYPKQFNHNFEIISFEDIRKGKVTQTESLITQAGQKFNELLLSLKGKQVHVSLSVEAIEKFRGCRDTLSVGLTVEEILEIFLLMGTNEGICLVDIAEFNPSVQDYQSSLLIINLLYYFMMGWTQRKK